MGHKNRNGMVECITIIRLIQLLESVGSDDEEYNERWPTWLFVYIWLLSGEVIPFCSLALLSSVA